MKETTSPDARDGRYNGPASAPKAFAICPDAAVLSQLSEVCSEAGYFDFVRTSAVYPHVSDFVRLIQVYTPAAIFVSAASLGRMSELTVAARREVPGVHVIAIHDSYDPQTVLEVMRLGLQEFIAAPFTDDRSRESLSRVATAARSRPADFHGTERVFSFLPAKQGVGTTTLAVTTASSLRGLQGIKTFLGDFDVHGGLIRFMLKLDCTCSFQDAVERLDELDERLWPQLVTSRQSLDIMHAGNRRPDLFIEPNNVRRLISHLRRQYKVIWADLSGNLEKYSLEIMRESKLIFLVATPELPVIRLTGEKMRMLADLDLGDRVRLLINRWTPESPLTRSEIERIAGTNVYMTFPNGYGSVHRALSDGQPVGLDTELGRQCYALAQQVSDLKCATKRGWRLTDLWSTRPAKLRPAAG